jgi:hypothetical protein
MGSDAPQTMRNVVFLASYLLIEINVIEMHPTPSAIDAHTLGLPQLSRQLSPVLLEVLLQSFESSPFRLYHHVIKMGCLPLQIH